MNNLGLESGGFRQKRTRAVRSKVHSKKICRPKNRLRQLSQQLLRRFGCSTKQWVSADDTIRAGKRLQQSTKLAATRCACSFLPLEICLSVARNEKYIGANRAEVGIPLATRNLPHFFVCLDPFHVTLCQPQSTTG